MKTITLQRLSLENFQGGNTVFEPDGQDTDVFGANAAGKTRLESAFLWLLTGKDSLGRADFEIKKLDSQGNHESGIDHTVEAVLSVNGIAIVLRKTYHEVWSKKRGSVKAELTGNTTDHYIDGVPVKESEYKTRINEIVGDEKRFRLLTDPTAFPALPWKEQRALLLEVCGDVSNEDVIATDPIMFPLSKMLEKYTVSKNPMDDLRKVVMGQRTEINKRIDQLPVRIDEVRRSLPDVSQLDKKALESDIAKLEYDLSNAKDRLRGVDTGAGIADLSKKLQGVNADIAKIEQAYTQDAMKSVSKLNIEIDAITDARATAKRQAESVKGEIKERQQKVAYLENELEKLRAKWTEINAEEFADTTATVCPACKQDLPADRVQEARDRALALFNQSKAERLTKNVTEGKALSASLANVKNESEELHKLIQEPEAAEGEDKLTALISQRDAVKAMADDYSNLEDRARLVEQKNELEAKIKEAREGVSGNKVEIEREVSGLMEQLQKTKTDLQKFENRKQGEARITELKAEEKKLAKEFEELEKTLFMLDTFEKTKTEMLTSRINEKFEIVDFKLFNQLVNGGVEPCCVLRINGIPYDSGLNSAGRTQGGLDIVRTLQKHFQTVVPIWIDNRESCTWIPDMAAQVISLYVSAEDKTLRIEKAVKERRAA